ncbi:hypothetical protein J7438_24085 [Thalassotalea sp. G20_0]|uniref:hypothetical protein n=1 Tax=Thalassotalea sp. G20_0 TaxID=2821093 RepID=UPI001ADA20F0|nr:hypothetical protein [Thalassotalea sp. G20_0]MBO9497141.1 hypothetical protein [Thalassotalea sp. G20_0]
MDPVNKPTSPSPQKIQPHKDNVRAASTGKSFHGKKTAIWQSVRTLSNKLIFWLEKPLKTRNIKVHVAKSSALSANGFNKHCSELLLAMIDGDSRRLPELLDKIRLSIPAAIPGKQQQEIESSDIIDLFGKWSEQCTKPALAKSLRRDLLNPESNIRKIWTSQRVLTMEPKDFSPQTFRRLNDIEGLMGQLAIALFPEEIEKLMQDVRSCESKITSSRFFQRFSANITT